MMSMTLEANEATALPPEEFIGADKLFAEARLGSISGPLKLGVRRTSILPFSVDCLPVSLLIIKYHQPQNHRRTYS